MRALTYILATLLITTGAAYGKKNAVEVTSTYYGVKVSQISAGTGHGVGYTFNASVLKGRKSLEVGVIYSGQEERLAGSDLKYRIFLGSEHRITDFHTFFKPYLQYNLLYQKSMSYAPDVLELNGETYEIPTEPGMVATIGHYVGYGNKIKLFGHTYLDSSIGLGFYQGSLDKINGPGTWGIHEGNRGLTFSFKVGVGYTFN